MLNFLKNTDPEKIMAMGKEMAAPAFQRAAALMPAYKKILEENNVNANDIKSVEDFSKLPILSKKIVFPCFDIEELCINGDLSLMRRVMTSSGFSGTYSFGINTEKDCKSIETSLDMGLQMVFNIDSKKSFLINASPMGVKVVTSLPLAETSVREDMVVALLKKISPKFEQTIILGDPHFIKKIVDRGNIEKIDWKKLGVSFILGEDWFSESFRSYLAEETEIDQDNFDGRLIGATMGMTELDLNIFHESLDTIRIRRAACRDKKLREALFGENETLVPIVFHYYPHRTYIEAIPENSWDHELVISMLSDQVALPLIRYNTGDRGKLFTHSEMAKILKKCGYEELIPEIKLPIVCVWGRKERFVDMNGIKVYPELIKQGLYENHEVAKAITGHFFLSSKETPLLEVQLAKGVDYNESMAVLIKEAALKYVSCDIHTVVYPYGKYPYAMEIDYEKKFNNLA